MDLKKIIVVKNNYDDFLFNKLNQEKIKFSQDKDLNILFKQLYD